jgi:hypothetical protein
LVPARVASRIEIAQDVASPVVAAARANARAAADRRLTRVGTRLAGSIGKIISNRIQDRPASASVSRVDPYLGFRGRYEVDDKVFALACGDIGVFGVGSKVTWNLYGANGTSLSGITTVEIGYRYLYTDYITGGFEYDVATKGGGFTGTRFPF